MAPQTPPDPKSEIFYRAPVEPYKTHPTAKTWPRDLFGNLEQNPRGPYYLRNWPEATDRSAGDNTTVKHTEA